MISLVPADLESVLEELGMEVGRSRGDEVWATCPNPDHDDSRPTNYSVNRESGSGYCFACGFRHETMSSLVTTLLSIDGWTAARWLRERGATISARLERLHERRGRHADTGGRHARRVEEEYSLESRFAVYGDPPRKVLAERALDPDSAADYDVRWDAERGVYVLPVYAPDGTLMGWQERTKPTPKNYPPGLKKSTTLFGIEIFRGGTAVLVESPLDAVRLWSVGVDGGLASYGVQVSDSQMRLITSRAEKLILALDDDDVGREKTDELVARYASRLPTWVFHYGGARQRLDPGARAKDPGDMTDSDILRGIREARFSVALPRKRRVDRSAGRGVQ